MPSRAERIGVAAAFAFATILLGPRVVAAGDTTILRVPPGSAGSNALFVIFKPPVPAPADVRGSGAWDVQVLRDAGLSPMTVPDASEVPEDYPVTGLVRLTLSQPLPVNFKRVEVRYRRGDAPLGTLSPKESKSLPGIVAVDDRKKADVYLSGILLLASEEKPLYTIDSVGNYQLWMNESGAQSWDISASAKADKRPHANLDSYVVGATFHHIGSYAPGNRRWIGARSLHWFSGVEMNSKARVTNVITAPRVVRPWTRHVTRKDENGVPKIVKTLGFTLDAALEAGWNLRNAVTDPAEGEQLGSGGILRIAPGATIYVTKPDAGFLNRVTLMADYIVRLPLQEELFMETRKSRRAGTDPLPQLNRRARHFAQMTASFMLSEFAGVELKYNYGSEPPAFKLVDHSGSLGLVVKFKQSTRVR